MSLKDVYQILDKILANQNAICERLATCEGKQNEILSLLKNDFPVPLSTDKLVSNGTSKIQTVKTPTASVNNVQKSKVAHSTPNSSFDVSFTFPPFPSPLPLLSVDIKNDDSVIQYEQFALSLNEKREICVKSAQLEETIQKSPPNNIVVRSPPLTANSNKQGVTFRKTFKSAIKSPNVSIIREDPENSTLNSENIFVKTKGKEETDNSNRRQRRTAAEKVCSYKEPSLIKKMRRNF